MTQSNLNTQKDKIKKISLAYIVSFEPETLRLPTQVLTILTNKALLPYCAIFK